MLRVDQVDGISLVRVYDDVDIANASHLEASIKLLHDEAVVVIDLERCPYFDSSGLSVLYRLSRNQHIIIFMPYACRIRRIFEIADLKSVFPLFETEADAVFAAHVLVKERKAVAS